MADYRELFSGAVGSLMDKARELAGSEAVRGAVDRLGSGGVAGIYAQGADRAKTYARITKLTLEANASAGELNRVYAEIGRLCFELRRSQPEGCFAPLFAQASELTEAIHAKEDEIAALKAQLGEAKGAQPEKESSFEDIVNATEQDGAGRAEQ